MGPPQCITIRQLFSPKRNVKSIETKVLLAHLCVVLYYAVVLCVLCCVYVCVCVCVCV